MFAVIRFYQSIQSVREAGERAQSGLVPILRQESGLKGWYVVDAGDGRAASVTIYESRQAAAAGSERALRWIEENLSDPTRVPPRCSWEKSSRARDE